MAVGENPILLLGMEKQAEHIEAEAVFLIRGTFICADQQTVLHLRVCQQHDLNQSVITSKQILSVKSSKIRSLSVKTLYFEVRTLVNKELKVGGVSEHYAHGGFSKISSVISNFFFPV